MSTERHTLRRMAMALAVAYLVVLQAFLGGIASGAHAAGSLEGFGGNGFGPIGLGQVICRGAQDTPASPTEPAHHTPDCCATGCLMSVGTALPPTAGTAPAARPSVVVIAVRPPFEDTLPTGVARSPRNARAPPLA
ncbi:hypothetical protein [Ancylobacter pratisalsi]|uniref:DUF2946 domain-containing protein n=1 Tax=Ancylobacter pratisalsi TaxID=1745854 RepID=A0A6P1YHR1_9HYPH|nr:hypothetical protein [Ancylobacter pratisalsi]QIB32848.1 hypothetical protein G3A50_03325 [Ancylobacter pratisalsi]